MSVHGKKVCCFDPSRQILVLQCFDAILKSLEKIIDVTSDDEDDVSVASGDDFNDDIVEKILKEFPFLESSDYEGIKYLFHFNYMDLGPNP